MILERYLDFSDDEVLQAFENEFFPKKGKANYLSPDFGGFILMDIEKQVIKLNFRWRCFKEKVYLKVLVRLVQKIMRFTILLEGMFGLLIMPTLRKLDISINFLCGYSKN